MENKKQQKLKTLKDLVNEAYRVEGSLGMIERIKMEAIKWIRKKRYKIEEEDWMDFFNLTNEEIK